VHSSIAQVAPAPHAASFVHGAPGAFTGPLGGPRSGAHAAATLAGAKSATSEAAHHGASVAAQAAARARMLSTHATTCFAVNEVTAAASLASTTAAVSARQRAASIGGCPAPTQQLENVLQYVIATSDAAVAGEYGAPPVRPTPLLPVGGCGEEAGRGTPPDEDDAPSTFPPHDASRTTPEATPAKTNAENAERRAAPTARVALTPAWR
jgi:hypothetical protein